MGRFSHRFYFKGELPKISLIKEKFFDITGLQLYYFAEARIGELLTKSEDILHAIQKTKHEKNYIPLGYTRFECHGFDNLYLDEGLDPKSRDFTIIGGYRTRNMYFLKALVKTMHELGGRTFNYHISPYEEDLDIEKYLEPYHPFERRWKNIKRWDEMSEMERTHFKGFFSDKQ